MNRPLDVLHRSSRPSESCSTSSSAFLSAAVGSFSSDLLAGREQHRRARLAASALRQSPSPASRTSRRRVRSPRPSRRRRGPRGRTIASIKIARFPPVIFAVARTSSLPPSRSTSCGPSVPGFSSPTGRCLEDQLDDRVRVREAVRLARLAEERLQVVDLRDERLVVGLLRGWPRPNRRLTSATARVPNIPPRRSASATRRTGINLLTSNLSFSTSVPSRMRLVK